MYKLNAFAMFGMLFLFTVLFGNGMYSNNISTYAQENQTGTTNEAEVNADIKEQENKCAKDTDCENENEINNRLDITNQAPQQEKKVTIQPPDGELTAEWWQWALTIPPSINPLTDQTGENCDVDQTGDVWKLAGTAGGDAERDCTIPIGKKILFPIITGACLELTDAITPPIEDNLKTCAKDLLDPADVLEASIDGKSIPNLQNFRVQSPVFEVTLPDPNVFGIGPTGVSQKSVSDGWWVLVDGLKPGQHTIEFTGGITGVFQTHVLYHITIE